MQVYKPGTVNELYDFTLLQPPSPERDIVLNACSAFMRERVDSYRQLSLHPKADAMAEYEDDGYETYNPS